ncbi:hypothetical protein UFOVP431_106 [uncultured Caudovirales phage]|uniref:Uncharacterized protein n=1 Tax=uncultured Caudovirales phage TaxID=2100421 RepID=A0A6J5MPV3_9CAUD|nr:hypothetical protein UFOVP431_106 [uncultured Caudovirales phage]
MASSSSTRKRGSTGAWISATEIDVVVGQEGVGLD